MEARIDTHPPIDSLKAFSLGLLDDASAHALFLHLEGCSPCRRRAEEASGDDFLARLQKARAANSTPAPAGQLPPLPGVARSAGHGSTSPPDPARSFAPSLFGGSSPADALGRPAGADLPPELAASTQYEVIRELGRGGMGVVYLARNKQMDRLEVLKVVNRTLLERPGTADRFLREIRSAAALEHKNVVRAYACLQAGKLLALVMEYVEGEDLARLVERRGPLSVSSACASVVQAARGLQEAHGKGMVHRDIKPQNLLLSRKLKEVMILDFGLAKVASEKGVEQGLTAEGKMLGTPGYVAPEQIRDAASADIRADIYSLGCTLYFLLTGRPPFDAPSLYALLHAHQNEEARPLNETRANVPPALAAVVAKMMAKEPARRYQNPAEVEAALAPFVKGVKPAVPAPPPKAEKKEPKTPSLPPPLPAHVQTELAPAPAVERAPFDLEDLPSPAVSRKRKKNRGALIAVAMALLVPLAVGIAMAVLRVETPNGTLIVEMDGDTEAKIKGGKLILTGPDGKERYRLSAVERSKKLDAGEYLIRVEGADGLEVNTPEFTMKKGGEVTVRVTIRKGDMTASDDKTSPFIAKDMSNWEGLIKEHWSYKDGVLTGKSGGDGIKFHTFLCSKKKYKDFELAFKVRLKNGVGNSGVQIRSKIVNENLFSVAGPQCDIGTGYWGGLWGQEFGNNQMKAAPKEVEDAVKSEEFNDYYIKCVGKHLTIKLNGITSIDEDFEKMPAEGIIGFQLHPGEAMEVTFKEIKFKELSLAPKASPDPKAAETALPPPPAPSAALAALSRDKIPPEALALAGDGDAKRAPASLVGVLGETRPIHSAAVLGLAYSPDGKWLASASADKTIMLRDTATGEGKRTLKGHTEAVVAVAFSNDGRTLISAGRDDALMLWSVEKEEKPTVLQTRLGQYGILTMAVSLDGSFVAVGGEGGLIKLWKWGSWEKPVEFAGLSGKVKIRSLAFSPDGKLLACGGEREEKEKPPLVRLYATADWTLKGTMPCSFEAVRALSFSHDGRHLASVGAVGNGRIWEVPSGKQVGDLSRDYMGGEWPNSFSVAWGPDDKTLAVGGHSQVVVHDGPTGKRRFVRWDITEDKWGPHQIGVQAVTFSPKGNMLAAGGHYGDVPVWDMTNWKRKYLERGHRHFVSSVACNPKGGELLSLGDESAVLRWQVARPREPAVRYLDFGKVTPLALHKSAISSSADGKTSVITWWSGMAVLNMETDKETLIPSGTGPLGYPHMLDPAVSPDGKSVAGGMDGSLRLWDLALGRQVHRFPPNGGWGGLAFSRDSKFLASCNSDKKHRMTVWNVATGNESRSWEVASSPRVSAFHPQGKILASGNEDGSIVLWDTATGQKIRALGGHSARIRALKFTPDGKTLVSSGDDGIIRLWNPEQSRVREIIPVGPAKRPLTFDLDPSGKYLFAAGQFPVIFILRLP